MTPVMVEGRWQDTPSLPYNDTMERAVDKTFVLVLCACLSVLGGRTDAVGVAWLVAAITLTSLASLMRTRGGEVARAVAIVTACVMALAPGATAALPLATFELALHVPWRLHVAWLCAFAAGHAAGDPTIAAVTLAAATVCALLATREVRLAEARGRLYETEDELSDRLLALRAQNRELEDARGEASQAATLAERTRMAREVHDGVGHSLTRLIYQVAALRLVHHDDVCVTGELDELRSGLDETMDAMRASVHALDDHAMDLRVELDRLAVRSPHARVSVEYGLRDTPSAATTRCLVAVAREALTNAERHAHARAATIHAREFPGLWQLTIENDGDMPTGSMEAGELSERGLGLRAMRERVESLGGTFHTDFDAQRFQVFASIPRKVGT